ncbi:hypothetical protein GQ53DRAFT_347368 [Thozetella sp. PMI_491]|nr:hypothetical protein GQ53DRAFT_347368 [Thozetella sp. PMI_491]
MDIVGTISASIHLAEVIIGQVKKFRDAPKQLQSISETVSFLQRILRQLKETLKPPPGASHAAVRLTKEGEEIGLHATDKCQRILERILTDVLGAELNVKDGTITLGLKGRLTWMVRDSTARELLKELKDAKEDLLLSNSVNQLALAQQSSRVDQEKLDYLTVMAALIFKQRPPENILGERPLGDAPVDIFSPDAPHQPGPPKGLSGGKAGFNSGAPVATTEPLDKRGLKAIDIRQGGITRLKRGHIPDYKLFESRYLRWINDPVNCVTRFL